VRRLLLGLAMFLGLALTVAPAWAHGLRALESRSDQAEVVLVSAEPTRMPDSAIHFARESVLASGERSAVDSVEVASILAVAIAVAGLAGSWRRDRRTAIATITAALVLGFVVETTPHLVHHSLDVDQGAGCAALQTAERSQAAAGAIDATPVPAPADLAEAPLVAPFPTCAAPAPRGRAPPA
jgi:hypothetical protein